MTATDTPVIGAPPGPGPDARALDAHVRRVVTLLTDPTSDATAVAAVADQITDACRAEAGRALALDTLAGRFGLDPFERDIVLAAVAYDIDRSAPVPTFHTCLRLPGAHWGALDPQAPLRAVPLIRTDPSELLVGVLRVEERILHHLRGATGPRVVDDRLRPWLRPLPAKLAERVLGPSHRACADLVATILGEPRASSGPTVLIHGPSSGDRLAAVAGAASRMRPPPDAGVWTVAANDVPDAAGERDGFARLVDREHTLGRLLVHVDIDDGDEPAARRAIDRFTAAVAGPVVVTAPDRVHLDNVDAVIELPRPSAAEQTELWAKVLGPSSADTAERLAGEFDLDRTQISHGARVWSAGGGPDRSPLHVARTRSRAEAGRRLDGLAERIEPRARWDDLVVGDRPRDLLRQLVDVAAGRTALAASQLHDRPPGVTALFAGPSGTGKTLAAEVVAAELGLDLYRIDLASVVSKWIGETEKHLRRVFDAADQGGTVLVFDEADALFGRRSEVHDSHDRHANIEVAYLLQRMEQHRGVAVLTTNFRSAIDEAFLRRVRILVPFAHPDETQRRALWIRLLDPASTGVPVESDVDVGRLAKLDLTGGDIRSIAVHASNVAAGGHRSVRADDIAAAVRADFTKRDRPLADLGGWPP